MKKNLNQILICAFCFFLLPSCQQQKNQANENQDTAMTAQKEKSKTAAGNNQSLMDAKNAQKREMAAGREGSLFSSEHIKHAKNFWSSRQIYYRDLTGDSSAEVYAAIKGQKYFDNTYIFVYATLEDQEGTSEYEKIAETIDGTKLDDRIFIWVHFTNDKKVKFIKKLISDNIRDVIEQGPNEI